MFQVESNRGADEVAEVLRGNQQLFRFLVRIRERRDRLARLVRDCIPLLPRDRVMFGGCYFAGTGEDPDTEQAFASGVLMRLIQDQDNVSWTEEAMREEARLQRSGPLGEGRPVAHHRGPAPRCHPGPARCQGPQR